MQARCSASSRVHESIQFRHPARFAGQRSAQSEGMEDARSGFAVCRPSVSERVSLAACSVDRRWFWLRSIISACARLRPSRRASEIANRSHGHRCPFRQPDAVEPSFLSCLPPVSESIKQVTCLQRPSETSERSCQIFGLVWLHLPSYTVPWYASSVQVT